MALLLGQCREQVQHERIGVPAEFGDDERHALRHQARNERHVAGHRSSLATRTLHLAFRAAARAAASWGLRSSASAPLPDSASTYSPMMVRPSASANRAMAALWA